MPRRDADADGKGMINEGWGMGNGCIIMWEMGSVLIPTYCSMDMCGIEWDVYFCGITWGGCSTLGTNRFDDRIERIASQ